MTRRSRTARTVVRSLAAMAGLLLTSGLLVAGLSTPAAAADNGAAIVKIARAEAANAKHNREIGGYNCNYYSTQLGVGPKQCSNGWRSEQWCADFVKWVWGKAGMNTSGATPAAASFESYGKKHHTWHTSGPKVGDAVVVEGGNHVGIVSKVSGGRAYVSGNTTKKGASGIKYVDEHGIPSSVVGYATPVK